MQVKQKTQGVGGWGIVNNGWKNEQWTSEMREENKMAKAKT